MVSDAGSVQITTTFNDVPWWIVLILFVLVALIALGVWRGTLFVRRARRAIAQVAQDAQDAPPTPLDSAGVSQPAGAARPAEAVNDVAAPVVSDSEELSLRPRRSRQ